MSKDSHLDMVSERRPPAVFTVIDNATGKPPDMCAIFGITSMHWNDALVFPWQKWEFLLGADATLYLMDACGNVVETPENRFTVTVIVPFPKTRIISSILIN